MELNQHHREALLHELEGAQKELETQNACLRKTVEGDTVAHWFEIQAHLTTLRINLIKTAITTNALDI